jgi:hypothetical protein
METENYFEHSNKMNEIDYCAASTECYQYRKSASSSVTYAWHNLTCNPTTCMLIASNGAPPPTPVSPFGSPSSIDRSKMDNDGSHGDMTQMVDGGFHHVYYHSKSFHNPAAVALTVVCSLVFIVVSVWLIRLGRKKKWWSKFKDSSKEKVVNNSVVKSWKHDNDSPRTGSISCVNSISSVPSSAPPSFSSGPLDMATVRHPHARLSILQQNPFQSPRSSSSSTQMEPLPSYLSPDTTLPKYEQAIVTQIRGFRGDESCSSSSNPMGQPSIGSMWVPVYFSHFRRVSNQLPQNVYGFPGERLSSPMQSFWIHSPPNTMSEASTDADITEER